MSNQDPAFLLYSGDWLTKTAEMSKAAKGTYIDLLCYQHLNGSIPSDEEAIARIVGLHDFEFKEVWNQIKHKFDLVDNRLVNQRLNQVMNERTEFAKKKRILGVYATLLRTGNYTDKQVKFIKKAFSIDSFLNIEEENLTIRLTEWLNQTVDRMVNRSKDVNVNEDIVVVVDKDTLKNRVEDFKNQILIFKDKYPEKMLNSFFSYWSETNRSGSKMRFEMEKAWELNRRLANWASRDKDFKSKKPQYGHQDVSNQDLFDQAKEFARRTDGQQK